MYYELIKRSIIMEDKKGNVVEEMAFSAEKCSSQDISEFIECYLNSSGKKQGLGHIRIRTTFKKEGLEHAIVCYLDPSLTTNRTIIEEIIDENDGSLFDATTKDLRGRLWSLYRKPYIKYPKNTESMGESALTFINTIWTPAMELKRELQANSWLVRLLLGKGAYKQHLNMIDEFIIRSYQHYENSELDICDSYNYKTRIKRMEALCFLSNGIAAAIHELYSKEGWSL